VYLEDKLGFIINGTNKFKILVGGSNHLVWLEFLSFVSNIDRTVLNKVEGSHSPGWD